MIMTDLPCHCFDVELVVPGQGRVTSTEIMLIRRTGSSIDAIAVALLRNEINDTYCQTVLSSFMNCPLASASFFLLDLDIRERPLPASERFRANVRE